VHKGEVPNQMLPSKVASNLGFHCFAMSTWVVYDDERDRNNFYLHVKPFTSWVPLSASVAGDHLTCCGNKVLFLLTLSLLWKLLSAKYIVCFIFKKHPIFFNFGGAFCLVVKHLGFRSDAELLGVWSGFKHFELLSIVANSSQRVKQMLHFRQLFS